MDEDDKTLVRHLFSALSARVEQHDLVVAGQAGSLSVKEQGDLASRLEAAVAAFADLARARRADRRHVQRCRQLLTGGNDFDIRLDFFATGRIAMHADRYATGTKELGDASHAAGLWVVRTPIGASA